MSTPRPGLVAAIKSLPRPVWILFGGTFINRFGSFVGVFIVLYLTHMGYSVPQAGLALAAFGLGSLPGSALGGYFADRVGRRETIVLATLVNAAATVGLALVQGLPLILALMAIVGTSFQAQRAPVAAMITDLVPAGNRVAAMGVMRFFVNAGFAAGPAAAGLLADRSFLLLFAGDALTSVIFGVIALVGLPGGAPRSTEPERRGEATRAILADRGFLVFMLACLMASAVYLQANATFPLWVKANGYSNAVYGGLISVNGVVIILAELLLISFTQKFEARRVIAAGFLLVGVGFALTAVAHTITLLALTVLIWTFGEMTAFPMSMAHVANLSPAHLRGRYQGAWGLSWAGGGLTVGPLLGTWLYASNPYLLWLACGVVGVVSAALVMLTPAARSDAVETVLLPET
jgi:MFS family permease